MRSRNSSFRDDELHAGDVCVYRLSVNLTPNATGLYELHRSKDKYVSREKLKLRA